ncbi:hypothetical protein OYC64_020875 [Pagothenia borchgrevinki]|uniref:Uncharacterized protein n=1 Tax=Pagothenia borchgrevinki TaxID=8213 RepID=A0ABD2FNK4_PAGBO
MAPSVLNEAQRKFFQEDWFPRSHSQFSLTHSPFLSISKSATYPQLNQSVASHLHSQSQHTRQMFKSALSLPCQHRSGELMQPSPTSFASSLIRSKARVAQKNPHH